MFKGLAMQEDYQPILTLYYKPSCPFCQKVLAFLKNIGKTIPLKNINQDLRAKKELVHLGGKSQVPCLFIDGKPLYESDNIINCIKIDLIP